VGGREVLALAVVEVEDQVVFGDEVTGVEAEKPGCLVDGVVRAFELDEGTDGGFVVIDEQVFSPFVAGRKFVGGAEFFVAEPAAEAETFEDFFEGVGIGEDSFQFFADFVAAMGWGSGWDYGELFGRRFECEEVTDGGLFGGRLVPFCGSGRGLGTDAQELAVLGETAVGGVEEEVEFVDTKGGGLGAEFGEHAEEGFGVEDAELDFDLGRHGGRRIAEIAGGGGGVGWAWNWKLENRNGNQNVETAEEVSECKC
jgi:hypothetical protein